MHEFHKRYDYIISKIREARMQQNEKAVKLWKSKLNKWQLEYGAYQPIR